ncbi:hypothetical protein Tco_1034735 [Tanacetum coccineum]
MEGESLTSVYERFLTLINLYDNLSQFEPHVNVFKAKKAARNHDPLAVVANSHAHFSNSHASPSYSRSPQPYYATHSSSVIDYEDDYQREIQGDAQEDKLTTAMMNQVVIQDGRVDFQSKNVGYVRNGNRNAGRQHRNQATNEGNGKTNVQRYNCNGKGHYAREFPKLRVRNANYFREQMLLATKDEAGVHLDEKENDFMLDNAYKDNTLEELNASVIMMAHIQPTHGKSDVKPKYDDQNHEKLKTVIHTFVDDQIDSDVILDNPYAEDNSGQDEHDLNALDQSYADVESLIYNVQVEAKNKCKMNNELQKQKALLQKDLETCKERVKEFKNK